MMYYHLFLLLSLLLIVIINSSINYYYYQYFFCFIDYYYYYYLLSLIIVTYSQLLLSLLYYIYIYHLGIQIHYVNVDYISNWHLLSQGFKHKDCVSAYLGTCLTAKTNLSWDGWCKPLLRMIFRWQRQNVAGWDCGLLRQFW